MRFLRKIFKTKTPETSTTLRLGELIKEPDKNYFRSVDRFISRNFGSL